MGTPVEPAAAAAVVNPQDINNHSQDMNNLVNQFQQQNLHFTLPFQNIHNFVFFKLDSTNFLLWRHQFESILMSTNLLRFVDGTYVEPPTHITINGARVINPENLFWHQMDRFIISCFNATLSKSVSSSTFGLTTSKQYWDYLRSEFSDQFVVRRSLLRGQLQTLHRGNLSVGEYLTNLKEITDNLAAINDSCVQ